jgi:hypothetical protein
MAGQDKLMRKTGYGLHYPIRHGQIENWVGTIATAKTQMAC